MAVTPKIRRPPAENAHVVDTELSDVELATFCCAYLTGEQMPERAALKTGERVLVTGASGGVGSGIVPLARARGAIPYAVVGKGKEQAVLDIGAQKVIMRGVADLLTAINDATGGEPVDGSPIKWAAPYSTTCCASSGPKGRYITAGAIAGRLLSSSDWSSDACIRTCPRSFFVPSCKAAGRDDRSPEIMDHM